MKNKDILVITEDELIDFFLDRDFNDNCFNSDGTLNKNYNSFKKTGVIASIFENHWNNYYLSNKSIVDTYRPNAPKEIKKVIDCHNKDLGCSVYKCPVCHDIVFIGNTCKSRLCSSCGYKYKNERVESIMETAYNCKHRHIVFTIPKELRRFFFHPFDRIDLLFEAVNKTIYSILNESFKITKKGLKKYKSKIKYSPGFFAFLHTFGRNLKWNPHIHILIAEIKLGSNNSCINWNYFDYDALSKRFMKILLDLISKELGSSFNCLKNKLYRKYPNGFYVYAEPKKFKNIKSGIEYVTRYCGRVPISENRILNYDGKNVTFSYKDHKDNSYHEVTISAFEFITLLLRHVIPEQYKIIRYYGFYRKKHTFHDKMIMLVSEFKHKVRRHFLKHEISVWKSFNRNPYNCPKCNTKMKYVLFVT